MRVAHVTATFPPYWGGTGNIAFHNARTLSQQGHDVAVFTGQQPGENVEKFPFPVRYLHAWVRIGNAPLTPILLRELRGFDVIHLHCPYILGAELTALASKWFRTPLVVTYHNDLVSSGARGVAFRLYQGPNRIFTLRHARTVLATSMDYAVTSQLGQLERYHSVAELPNAVDVNIFTPAPASLNLRDRLRIPDQTPIVLFVGALDRAHFFKGVPLLIEALSTVRDAHLIAVGDGDLRPEMEQAAMACLGSRAHFVGSVAQEELVDLYRLASVTVLPSTTRGEAFGIVLLESLSCGTPVIASNLPGVRTVVYPDVDGLLVSPGDAQSLAVAIQSIIDAPDRAAQMGAAGRAKVVRSYSWSVIGERLGSLYESVLNAPVASDRGRPTSPDAVSP